MARFGERSTGRLETVHPILRRVAEAVIVVYDHTILQGTRGQGEQDELFEQGRTKVKFPDSKHNYRAKRSDVDAGYANEVMQPLSLAIDVAPWFQEVPHVRWNRQFEFTYLAGLYVMAGEAIARPEGFGIRWGGNWDRDEILITDQTFDDLPHIELVRLT